MVRDEMVRSLSDHWSEMYQNERPPVARGDWFRTVVGKKHCCRMYCLPGVGLIGNVVRGTYIGPVHDVNVSENEEFLAVLVPFPHSGADCRLVASADIPKLVWITVHCAHNLNRDWSQPVSYADKVPCAEFAIWKRNGWTNHFWE